MARNTSNKRQSTQIKKPSNEILERSIGLRAIEGEGNERKFRLSFSSETPYERWFGPEILDHSEGAVDLSRLNEIGVLLFNHDTNRPLGPVLKAWVENGRGEAEVAFDEDPDSDLIYRKVVSGTLKGVSVRYRVDVWEEVAANKTSSDGRFKGPCYIARKWTVYEISIVSVPADASVGVGREMDINQNLNEEDERSMGEENVNKENVQTGSTAQASERAADPAATPVVNEEQVRAAERARITEINTICREFDMDPQEHIDSGRSVAEVRKLVLEHLMKNKKPIAMSGIEFGVSEADKIRAAARDGLLLRGGLTVDKPAAGANEFRNMSLRELAIFTLQREGHRIDPFVSNDDLLRQFFTPGAAFPAILDQTVQAAYETGYRMAPATFNIWTVIGSLSDFKPTKGYYAGGAGDFIEVPESGELKHDKPVDYPAPARQLKTYGRQFTLSRQAFINDDIGFVTSIPARYAAAGKRTLNKQVYALIAKNTHVLPDGNVIFNPLRGNIIDPGTAPSGSSIQAMILQLALQTDPAGEPYAFEPRYILVPVGLGDPVRQIIGSRTVAVTSEGLVTTQANPLYDRQLVVVEDPQLNILGDNFEWYLVADKASAPFIEVDYLNGQEIPTIRRMEAPGQLGFIWDIYLDWGITVIEPKAAVKNEGAAGE